MAESLETIRLIRIRAQMEGAEATAADLGRVSRAQQTLAQATDAVGVAEERATNRRTSAIRAFERIRLSLDGAASAQETYRRKLDVVTRAEENREISARAALATIEKLRAAYERAGDPSRFTGPNIDPTRIIGATHATEGFSAALREAMEEAVRVEQAVQRVVASLEEQRQAASMSARELQVLRALERAGVDAFSPQGTDIVRRVNEIHAMSDAQKRGKEAADAAKQAARDQATELARLTAVANSYRQVVEPLALAEERRDEAIRDINAAFASGAIKNQETYTKSLQHAHTVYENTVRDYKGLRGFTTSQATSISYQINDIVSGLAMGQAPMTILMQQGGQVYQALADTPGGAAQGVKQLGGYLMSLLTPVRVATISLAGMGIVAAMAFKSYLDGQKELERSLTGMGRATGQTTSQLNGIAVASAEASGMSVASSRQMIAAYAATGRIGVSMFGDLNRVMKDYAATTGQELPEASKELIAAFANPTRGAEMLSEKLGILDAKTLDLIRRQHAAGDTLGAQRTLFNSLGPALVDHASQLTAVGRAWEYIKRTASDAYNAVGNAIAGPNLDQQVEQQRARVEEARRRREQADADANRPTGQFRGRRPVGGVSVAEGRQRALEREEAALAELEAQQHNERVMAQIGAENQRAQERSKAVAEAIQNYDQEGEALRKLQDQHSLLDAALRDESITRGLNAAQMKAAREAREAMAHAMSTHITAAERVIETTKLELMAIEARSPAEKAHIARLREELALRGQHVGEVERAARAAGQEAIARAQAEHSIREATEARQRSREDTINSARLENDLIGRTNSEAAALRFQYEQLAAAKEAARQNGLTSVSPEEITRINEATEAMRKLNQEQTRRRLADDIGFERSTMWLSDAEQRVARQLRGTGYGMDSPQARELLDLERWKDLRSAAGDALKGFVSDLRQGKSLMEAMSNVATKMLDKLLDRTMNAALDGLFRMFAPQGAGAPSPGVGINPFQLLGIGGGGQIQANDNRPQPQAPILPVQSAPLTTAVTPVAQGGNIFAAMQAIAAIESGNGRLGSMNYNAIGPLVQSGRYAGERAIGAYQIMPGNVPEWSRRHLGFAATPDQVLRSPDLQDRIFQGEFGRLMNRHGPSGAARAWFAGEGGMNNFNRDDPLGTTVGGYGSRFESLYSRATENAVQNFNTAVNNGTTAVTDSMATVASGVTQGGGQIVNSMASTASSILNSVSGGGGRGVGILGGIFRGLGGGGGAGDDFGGTLIDIGGGHLMAHTGGVLGLDRFQRRLLSHNDNDWSRAPRYHTGHVPSLAPNEVKAILRNDEGVFTKGQMAAMGAGMSKAPNITFITPPGAGLEPDGPPQQQSDGSMVQALKFVEGGMAKRAARGQGSLAPTLSNPAVRRG